MDSPGLSAAGVRFLAVLCPLWNWPALAIGWLDASRLQRGCHNGVATFRIGKRRWARWPLYAGSRAPSQASRSSLLTLTPVRTPTATHVPFCITTLRPRLHSCSTRHQLFLAEISTVAVYFPCAFTTCLRPRGYPRHPGRMAMGLWCLPSLISPPF